jgi:hypothetical protein
MIRASTSCGQPVAAGCRIQAQDPVARSSASSRQPIREEVIGSGPAGAGIPEAEVELRLARRDLSDWLAPRCDSGGLVGARPTGQQQARNGRPREY